jgi:hypothetical protein
MRKGWNSTSWVWLAVFLATLPVAYGSPPPLVSLQEDGSLVIADAKGAIADFVKQGTPRQSIEIEGQSCNVSYGMNSAGKKTILLSVPASASSPVVFDLGQNRITVPPKAALRLTLSGNNQVEKQDGNPANAVQMEKLPASNVGLSPLPGEDLQQPSAPPTPPPTQASPVPASTPSTATPTPTVASPSPPAPLALEENSGWPGRRLNPPLEVSQIEEDRFYARTEFGVRFVNALNVVNLPYTQLAFDPGYRQDFFAGVWLTEWFGLGLETGFAVNPARGNTPNLNLSNATYWNVPLLAQLCFQYPNESGWVPYLQVGFGAGWTFLRVGSSTYVADGTSFVSSGNGHGISNAYEITAGLRYRLYDQLSFTMAYKLYGCSQVNVDFAAGNLTLDSPLTNTFQLGFQYSF